MPTLDWLDREAAFRIAERVLRAFVSATVRRLVNEQRIPVEQLARHQYALVQRLTARIAELRDEASRGAFKQYVLDRGWDLEASAAHVFAFNAYPVAGNKRYQGKFRFAKHYCPVLANLKDGGEEWRCALAIDQHRKIRRWVRNIDSDATFGFWLPTSFGRFYPDFVCELTDGTHLVVEYKGAQIRGMPKEIEKAQVGKVWAESSQGRCRFTFIYALDIGMNMAQQLDAVLA